jgi:hypothetical protein
MAKHAVEASEISRAPRDKVWAVVADLKGWKDWGPWELSDVVQEGSPDPNGVGAVRLIRADKRSFGRKPTLREQVNVFEPPQRFGYTVLKGMPVKNYQATVTLTEAGEGTEIVFHIEFDPAFPGVGGITRSALETFGADATERLAREAERR